MRLPAHQCRPNMSISVGLKTLLRNYLGKKAQSIADNIQYSPHADHFPLQHMNLHVLYFYYSLLLYVFWISLEMLYCRIYPCHEMSMLGWIDSEHPLKLILMYFVFSSQGILGNLGKKTSSLRFVN